MRGTVLGSTERRWPDRRSGPWTLRLTFGIVDDRPAVVAVEVYAVDPAEIKRAARGWPALGVKPRGGPITSTGIRVPLGEALARYLAQDYLADAKRRTRIIAEASSFPPKLRRAAERRLQLLDGSEPRPGRPPLYGRAHYERVARIYLEALRMGKSPTRAVARQLHASDSAAAKWVAKARDLELLPRTAKGKAAGWPVKGRYP